VPGQCLELDYRRPTQQQVAKRMMGICGAEGLSLNEATMHALVEGANGDLRLILGQLQVGARARAGAGGGHATTPNPSTVVQHIFCEGKPCMQSPLSVMSTRSITSGLL
jgi:DNA polymerase III delta prime subunit